MSNYISGRLQESNIDFDIDLDKFKEIKNDPISLAKEFTRLFGEFRKYFRDDQKMIKFFIIHEKISLDLVRLIMEMEGSKRFIIENRIREYVLENYYTICDFIDLILGVNF